MQIESWATDENRYCVAHTTQMFLSLQKMLLPIFMAVSEANVIMSCFVFMDYLHSCYSKYVT